MNATLINEADIWHNARVFSSALIPFHQPIVQKKSYRKLISRNKGTHKKLIIKRKPRIYRKTNMWG
jgi:hypothetical protein